MANPVLDFERPIFELEDKVAELRNLSKTNKIDVGDEIAVFEKKLKETKQKIYLELTAWQRVDRKSVV